MGKKKTRFNFLDFLLVLAVFALVAGIIWRQELTDRLEIIDSENTLTVVCEFELVPDRDDKTVYNHIQFPIGSTEIYMDGVAIGNIEKVVVTESAESSEETTDETSDEAEQSYDTEQPAKVTETELLKLSAVSKDSGYYLEGDVKLYVNSEYRFHTKIQEFTVRIISIEEQQ